MDKEIAIMDKEIEIIKYEPHGCEYTMLDNRLFDRQDSSEEWAEVNLDTYIAEGRSHYEVYKHFGKEKWYVDYLFHIILSLRSRL